MPADRPWRWQVPGSVEKLIVDAEVASCVHLIGHNAEGMVKIGELSFRREDDRDIDPALLAKLKAQAKGTVILGEDNEATRAVMDELPKVIARRVKAMIPKDFELRESSLKMQLAGQILGCGVKGEAVIKFGPKGK
jgi:hypothetical protein